MPSARKPLLNVTARAAAHLQALLTASGHARILIGVKGGGCNGLKYIVEPTSDAPAARDEALVVHGVPLTVCGRSLVHLIGTTVTWKADALGSRVDFDNPNATSRCGCGETFNVDR